ncbi:MAG TPA: Hsp20/alpha crystallin family protein [Candidatus Binataceae bacterium]|nr:Hsp20/alpha crystallin family protein [Candidatus Binataceae bacterium]
MALIRFQRLDPVSSLLDVQRELERFLRNPSFSLGPSGYGAFPPVNVFEDSDGIVLIAELPGIDLANLKISGQGSTVTLSGERPREQATDVQGYHRRERRFGEFSRSIQLSDELDMAKATATYQAGVLSLRIPKAEAAKARQISVQAA